MHIYIPKFAVLGYRHAVKWMTGYTNILAARTEALGGPAVGSRSWRIFHRSDAVRQRTDSDRYNMEQCTAVMRWGLSVACSTFVKNRFSLRQHNNSSFFPQTLSLYPNASSTSSVKSTPNVNSSLNTSSYSKYSSSGEHAQNLRRQRHPRAPRENTGSDQPLTRYLAPIAFKRSCSHRQ